MQYMHRRGKGGADFCSYSDLRRFVGNRLDYRTSHIRHAGADFGRVHKLEHH